MSNVFKPSMTQTNAPTLLMAASTIVVTSALALDDDHAATVKIVEQALGRFSPDEVNRFVTGGSDPATAAQIVYAALETEASRVDDRPRSAPARR